MPPIGIATDNRTFTGSVCDLNQLQVHAAPFPHIIHSNFIAPAMYKELCRSFPNCPPSIGPTGFSLYWGDEEYTRLLNQHAVWRSLFETFHSQSFIDWASEVFAHSWQTGGCRIDPSAARYVPYREDRIDKERATLRHVEHAPAELFVRMDIHQGRVGYDRRVHVDHARRLVSMLIYMCDLDEIQMQGGELCLHSDPRGKPVVRITPRHNLMVAFPCSARSYHSVAEITNARMPRNYIQVHISSSVDLWPREAVRTDWKGKFRSLKRRLVKSP